MASTAKRGRSWVVRWREGARCREKAYPDKRSADAARLQRTLEERGVVERDVPDKHQERPILDVISDWHADIVHRGRTSRHAALSRSRAALLLDKAGVSCLRQLSAQRVQAALGELDASLGTRNHYLRAAKSLSRWCWFQGWLESDPLAGLRRYNAEVDRRRERRALTDAEIVKLLAASDPERCIVYRIALGSGLRLSEIRSLTPDSFALDAEPPTITVEAGYSKHRRRDVQPVARDLAEAVRPFVERARAGGPLFDLQVRVWCRAAQYLRRDLRAAGIPYRTEAGYVDFHSLRHTYITRLVRSGVSPATARLLARHTDVNLTLKAYTHLGVVDTARAVPSLPVPVPEAEAEAARIA